MPSTPLGPESRATGLLPCTVASCAVTGVTVLASLPLSLLAVAPPDNSTGQFIIETLNAEIGPVGMTLSLAAFAVLAAIALYRNAWLDWIVAASVAYYVGAVAVLHVLHPDLDPIKWPVSGYVLTGTGWLMTTTFFVLSTALLATALRASAAPRCSKRRQMAIALLALSAGGIYVAGVFPTERAFPPETLDGKLHAVGGFLAFPTTGIATVILSLEIHLKRKKLLLFLGYSLLAVMLLEFGAYFVGLGGIAQRVMFLLLFAWMIAACSAVRRDTLVGSTTG